MPLPMVVPNLDVLEDDGARLPRSAIPLMRDQFRLQGIEHAPDPHTVPSIAKPNRIAANHTKIKA